MSIALTRRVALAAAYAVALTERVRTGFRRLRRAKPRLIWGPVPVISIKYWSEAMRRAGYESTTVVKEVYSINREEDFDVLRDRFLPRPRGARFRDLAFFLWALRHGDVFIRFFDGGFLRFTEFDEWEGRLTKLAGKKLIVSPYGADVAVNGHLRGLEGRLYADYPTLGEMSDVVEEQVRRTASEADLVIRNWQIGYLPRHDAVWLNMIAIDTGLWEADGVDSGHDGRDGAVTFIHTPNHRNIKGTDHFERAVEELRAEGLQVELVTVSGRPNDEVREAAKRADVVADQLMLPGYAMAAVEAMAVGKPVIANLDGLDPELLETEAGRACPIVTADPDSVVEAMRRLVTDPARRSELGAAGRRFVERFHGYPAVAATWAEVIDHVWWGRPLPSRLQPLPSPIATDPERNE